LVRPGDTVCGTVYLVGLSVGLVVDLFSEPAALDVWGVQPAYMPMSNTFGSYKFLIRKPQIILESADGLGTPWNRMFGPPFGLPQTMF
jgi:hypothetical protein